MELWHPRLWYHSSKGGAETTAERIRGIGSDASVFQADISSWDDVKEMAEAVVGQFGGLDVLVKLARIGVSRGAL